MLKLGENLKKFRLKRELTQEQLADVLGVSAQAISRWENGNTYPAAILFNVATVIDLRPFSISARNCTETSASSDSFSRVYPRCLRSSVILAPTSMLSSFNEITSLVIVYPKLKFI